MASPRQENNVAAPVAAVREIAKRLQEGVQHLACEIFRQPRQQTRSTSSQAPELSASSTTATLEPTWVGHAPNGRVGQTSKEDLGRSTWTLLHILAAQFPDKPNKEQQRDAKTLVDILTRIYPCAECAEHFQVVVRDNPPKTGSGEELRQWMCAAHNMVNERLHKPSFNCRLVDLRWGALDCDSENACAMTGAVQRKSRA